jgi:hypothetical protein
VFPVASYPEEAEGKLLRNMFITTHRNFGVLTMHRNMVL